MAVLVFECRCLLDPTICAQAAAWDGPGTSARVRHTCQAIWADVHLASPVCNEIYANVGPTDAHICEGPCQCRHHLGPCRSMTASAGARLAVSAPSGRFAGGARDRRGCLLRCHFDHLLVVYSEGGISCAPDWFVSGLWFSCSPVLSACWPCADARAADAGRPALARAGDVRHRDRDRRAIPGARPREIPRRATAPGRPGSGESRRRHRGHSGDTTDGPGPRHRQSRRAAADQHAHERRRQAEGTRCDQPSGQSGDLRDDEAAPDACPRIALATARADDVVLDEPFQRLLRQGQHPLDPGGIRRAGGARARPRQVQRSRHGHGDISGDARVSRQRPERSRQDQ